MTLEKLEGRRNLRARHGSRLTVSSRHGLHVYTESEAKEVCWFTWRSLECPSTPRTLFSGLRVSAHGKQVAPLFGQVLTDFARGGRRANSSPGPARGDTSLNKSFRLLLRKSERLSIAKSAHSSKRCFTVKGVSLWFNKYLCVILV